jgi:hypothetical protein
MFANSLKEFLSAEAGAVTVDFVVLTAALVGLGVAAAASVRNGAADLGQDVQATLAASQVVPLGCLGWPCQPLPPVMHGVNQACQGNSCSGFTVDDSVAVAPPGG